MTTVDVQLDVDGNPDDDCYEAGNVAGSGNGYTVIACNSIA